MTSVRIRGIYATALTSILGDEVDVVAPSDAIDARFEQSFPADGHDVAVESTGDRLGVGVVGTPDGVDRIANVLAGIGRDTFSWLDEAPRGAILDATVTRTRERGAILDLGSTEGFLPPGADDGATKGETLTVQVHEPAPPWTDDRPVVRPQLRAQADIVDLRAGDGPPRASVADDATATELVRLTDTLSVDVPDGWSVHWNRSAADADLDTLAGALAVAADRARAHDERDDRPPTATAWLRFGGESRFALDEHRRGVTGTMPGHHRIKAATTAASAAVDFAERLCEPSGEFPFDLVADCFGPAEGDELEIHHGKPDGSEVSLGSGTVTNRSSETVTVSRELTGGGVYDALGIPIEDGDVATTTFREGRWWYPTVYRDADGDVKGTYVNVCTPVELFPAAASYVDLHVDVIRHTDGTVDRVDEDELAAAVEAGHVSEELAARAREVAGAVESGLS